VGVHATFAPPTVPPIRFSWQKMSKVPQVLDVETRHKHDYKALGGVMAAFGAYAAYMSSTGGKDPLFLY